MKNKYYDIALAVLSALLLMLSTAGFGFSFLVFFAFVPLFFAVARANVNPILLGWLVGFLYFVTGLSWMLITFGHFGGAPIWAAALLLSVLSVAGGLFFFAPFTYIAKRYPNNALLLGMVFIALEAVKSTVFFAGVPWLNLAQSQYQNITILQFVSIGGEFGLSFIIMVINVLIYNIVTRVDKKLQGGLLAAACIIMIMPGIFREFVPLKHSGEVRVLIVQTGYKQEMKWVREKLIEIVNNINSRLMKVDRKNYDLIIMPETTYPTRALETQFIMDVLTDVAFDTPILFGTPRIEEKDGKRALYNSMVFIQNGIDITIYNKMHLTPFGEYFPFQTVLEPLKKFFFGPGDMFTAGDKPVIFVSGKMKIAPLICYEGAFSELLRAPIVMGANVVAMISNDTWFGTLWGRKQHLAIDAVRAAEYGRAIMRSTQDGISAVLLPNGEVAAAVYEPIPAEISYNVPLVEERTLYSYIGNLWIAIIIPFVYYLMKRRKKGSVA